MGIVSRTCIRGRTRHSSDKMWRFVLLAAFVAAVQGAFDVNQNITALWERIHELEDRTIHVHVHGGRVYNRQRGRHGEHGESRESHEHEHGDHVEHEDHGEHSENDEHIHVHVHGGHPRGKDFFHNNPLPGAHAINVDYVHGVCHFRPGSVGLSGNIYMRQDFMGQEPVEMEFEVSGFTPHAHAHYF